VAFRTIDDSAERCDYEQVTRLGPVRLRQRFRLLRSDPARQVNELVAGAFAPGSITFEFAASGNESTVVTATLRSERSGVTRIAAPLLRPLLGRALAKGLEEDRADLESGNYAQR
jgi:hypothetical protein